MEVGTWVGSCAAAGKYCKVFPCSGDYTVSHISDNKVLSVTPSDSVVWSMDFLAIAHSAVLVKEEAGVPGVSHPI